MITGVYDVFICPVYGNPFNMPGFLRGFHGRIN